MPFIIGLLIGAAATFMVMCILTSKKINEAYMEGYKNGQENALHRVDRGNEECSSRRQTSG